MAYTTNYCLNPAFQNGLTGYASLMDAEIFLDTTSLCLGNVSCQVVTDGLVAGEGISTASGIIPDNSTGAASIYVRGEGTVNVSAEINPGSTLITQPVMLTSTWQRITLNGIAFTPGLTVNMLVYTTEAQATAFWIANVQIENHSPAHNYVDGDQPFCDWILPGSTFGVSEQLYHFPTGSAGQTVASGDIVPVLNMGEIFFTSAAGVTSDFSGFVHSDNINPIAAFTDFGIYQLTDPDPAQTYVSWNNGGTSSGTSGASNRIWSIFYPPQDYFVSGGAQLYKRAAYMAVGFQFNTVPAAGTQSIDLVQAEILPITTAFAQPAPSAYDEPRKLHSIIKPDRLNFVTNPSFETSIASWSAVGSATLATDSSITAGSIIEYDDFQFTAGTKSMKVTVNTSGDGTQISLTNLIIGNTYIVSAYLLSGPGILNINLACEGGSASAQGAGLPYGDLGYGTGEPYGGILPGVDLATVIGANPTWEVDASGWTAQNGVTLTRSGTQHHSGSFSGKLVPDGVTASPQIQGTAVPVTPGNAVVFYPWLFVSGGPATCFAAIHFFDANNVHIGASDITVSASVTTSFQQFSVVGTVPAGAVTASPFVGITGTPANTVNLFTDDDYFVTDTWARPNFTFTAAHSTETIVITSTPGSDFVSPSSFWIDAVLVEVGQDLLDYFDGNFGTNFFWEGTANLSRSYYYKQFKVRTQAVNNVILKHVPLGIHFQTAQTSVPYTQ